MNTTDATPAADRGSECNDLLGPLPERAMFETWAVGQGYLLNRIDIGGCDDYGDLRTEGAWEAWKAAVAAERERYAKLCEPTTPRPCDCERCDCGNSTDARMVAEWDEAAALAKRIRGA